MTEVVSSIVHRAAFCRPHAQTGVAKKILRAAGDLGPERLLDIISPREAPELYVVNLSCFQSGDAPDARIAFVVTWGNDALHQARVDGSRGTSFSVVGRILTVDAVVESAISANEVDLAASVAVGGSVAPGSLPPTYTVPFASSIAATAVQTVVIPRFARRVKILRVPADIAIDVEMMNVGAFGQNVLASNEDCPELIIPNGAGRVRVRNNDVTDAVACTAVFELCLG